MLRLATALALGALALGAVRAEDHCAEGQCDAQEDAALLQHAATKSSKVSAHNYANTTETKTVTCYSYPDASCGASKKCILDTTGCTASGGGCGCKAAGPGAGLEQCRFCDTGDGCGAFCSGVTPGPTPPTPAPPPTTTPAPPTPSVACGDGGFACASGQTCVGWPGAANSDIARCVEDSCANTVAIDNSGFSTGLTCGEWVNRDVQYRGITVEEATQSVACRYSSCSCIAYPCGFAGNICCDGTPVCVGGGRSYQCTGICANNVVAMQRQTCAQLVATLVGTGTVNAAIATCNVGAAHTECACMRAGCPVMR